MAKYRFRETYRGVKSLVPDIVAGELDRLRSVGPVTASGVVDIARPDSAPLHPAFEWDDTKAGEQFRLVQARTLIRAVVVVSDLTEDGREESVPMFIHVPDRGAVEGHYTLAAQIADDSDEYERALTEAERHMTSAEQRVHELRRLAAQRGGNVEAIAIALGGFATVREALALLRAS